MTVKDVKSIIAGMKDDDKVNFVRMGYDEDCFPMTWIDSRNIVKIVKMSARRKPTAYGGYYYSDNEEG